MNEKYILLVEDSPSDIDLTRRAFKRNNVANEIVVKEDGQDAIEFLREATNLPTLILLDLKLPRVDGLEVLKLIRADSRLHRLPVVMLTSSSEEIDLGNCYDAGVNSYIRKPVDFAQFDKAVQQLNLFWMVTNNPPPPVS